MSPTELYQKARVPNKILQLEAKSGDWGVMIKHKDNEAYIHDPHQQIQTQTSENWRNKAHTKIQRK
jgi:hypothetical protein